MVVGGDGEGPFVMFASLVVSRFKLVTNFHPLAENLSGPCEASETVISFSEYSGPTLQSGSQHTLIALPNSWSCLLIC